MYCIECGTQIPNNSKFCKHCGKPQTEEKHSVKELISEKIIETKTIKRQQKSLDYEFLKKAMGFYIAWVLLHLSLLLIFSYKIFGGNYKTADFWPFQDDDISVYDFTEFLVYTIIPLGILIVWSLLSAQKRLDYEILKKAKGFYITWLFLHLGMLLFFSSNIFGHYRDTNAFWPLDDDGSVGYTHGSIWYIMGTYDFTEFLFYAILPLGIFIAWCLVNTKNQKEQDA